MPAKSQAQYRLMQAVAHGNAKTPGLSANQAAEYVAGQKGAAYKELPARAGQADPPEPDEDDAVKTVRKHNARRPKHLRADEGKAADLIRRFRERNAKKET